jgi:2,4-dienoyl-CoA reductase-like NADH-dependent reductase (Old Yellow Enzyme family)/NADPH-dependent 2,4-dienoyl-CoA reductase/sulfur reductase-like enzyme
MEKNLATAEGAVTQRYVDYCEARAAGGAALITLESMYVDPAGKNHVYQLGLHDDALIPGYRALTDRCHDLGALVGAELQFGGRETSSLITGVQPVAPSAVPCMVLAGGEVPRELDVAEIRRLLERFAEAARRAVRAGFDAVEIHGAHGYLVGQFLSPFANRRTDAYGGDAERRLRFPLEVVAAVRDAVGGDVPVLYRISAEEHVDGGLTIDDVVAIAPRLERAGVDLIDVTAGIYESAVWMVQPMEMGTACLAPLARCIRGAVGIPVSVAGRIADPTVAETVLAAGDADFVTIGRALHADAAMPEKAAQGRLAEITPCVACLTCSDLLGRNQPVLCLANTATARERESAIRPADRRRRIVVVGAGPAGLEAARVLALRGHRVLVLERGAQAGGQLRLVRHVPGRHELAGLVAYLCDAAERAGAEIRAGVDATLDVVMGETPDAVVVATGARPGVPTTPGIMNSPAVDPFEVLRRPAAGVRRALVIGGGLLGVGVAHVLAERGLAEVVLAEAGADLATEIGLRPRWQHVANLRARPNVTIHVRTTVEQLDTGTALLRRDGADIKVEALDLVVATRPLVSVSDLADDLRRTPGAPPFFTIGDAVQPRTAFEAMQDAAALAHRL